jgi:hypothetical protein
MRLARGNCVEHVHVHLCNFWLQEVKFLFSDPPISVLSKVSRIAPRSDCTRRKVHWHGGGGGTGSP